MSLINRLTRSVVAGWYRRAWWCYLLWPLSQLFKLTALLRRCYLQRRQCRVAAAVVVVGNITVGGNGKTPVVLALAQYLQQQGYSVAVIMRGFKARCQSFPHMVQPCDRAELVGDEAKLLANHGLLVIVDPDRCRAAQLACQQGCDVVLSDDGLQHYRMARDIELAVVGGPQGLQSLFCLPSGPLREPYARLRQVDYVLTSAGLPADHGLTHCYKIDIICHELVALAANLARRKLTSLQGQTVHAVAGIGNPDNFFSLLRSFGANVIEHAFPDHYQLRWSDVEFADQYLVVMTEKDAVKLEGPASDRYWYVPISVKFEDEFINKFTDVLTKITRYN